MSLNKTYLLQEQALSFSHLEHSQKYTPSSEHGQAFRYNVVHPFQLVVNIHLKGRLFQNVHCHRLQFLGKKMSLKLLQEA